jgi:hypothetical protein
MTLAVASLVALYGAVIFAGKHARRLSAGNILFITAVAVLQVAAVMYVAYNYKIPIQ